MPFSDDIRSLYTLHDEMLKLVIYKTIENIYEIRPFLDNLGSMINKLKGGLLYSVCTICTLLE